MLGRWFLCEWYLPICKLLFRRIPMGNFPPKNHPLGCRLPHFNLLSPALRTSSGEPPRIRETSRNKGLLLCDLEKLGTDPLGLLPVVNDIYVMI